MKNLNKYLIALLTLASSLFAGNTEVVLPLDGNNTVIHNMEYTERGLNRFSVVYGNPYNEYPFSYLKMFENPLKQKSSKYSLNKWEIFGSLQSETGDLMLNKFDDDSGENRDHSTNFAISYQPKNSSLKFLYSYRYVDTYSDRFDRFWQNYDPQMKFDQEGLVKSRTAGYVQIDEKVTSAFFMTAYGNWGATPLYFQPIYKRGYKLHPFFKITFPKSILSFVSEMDIYEEYRDHYNPTKCTKTDLTLTWEKNFGKQAGGKIYYTRNSELNPLWKIGGDVSDTLDNIFRYTLGGALHSDVKPEFSGLFDFLLIPKVTVSLEGGLEYHEELKSYSYTDHKDTITYKSYRFYEPWLHASVQYHDTLFFPANLKIWYDHSFKRTFERIEWKPNYKIEIYRDSITENPLKGQFGISGDYEISWKFLQSKLWGALVFTPENINVQYLVPYQMGIDIEIKNDKLNHPWCGLYFATRSKSLYRYYNMEEDRVVLAESPGQTSLSVKAAVPFLMPFVNSKLKTSLELEAKPLRFSKEARLREHPYGNEFGPLIKFGIRAKFN